MKFYTLLISFIDIDVTLDEMTGPWINLFVIHRKVHNNII
jgi:hypothetical protein